MGAFWVSLTITLILFINLMLSYAAMPKVGKMPERKFVSLRNLLLIILVPFIISLIANYTTWFRTRDHVQITFRLKDWTPIGAMWGNELSDLRLTYDSKPVKNVLKVSWQIENTGTIGIPEFETPPLISYPKSLNVAEARISCTSPLLKINRKVSMDSGHGTIGIDGIGVLNPGDFFQVDIYVLDPPAPMASARHFSDWQLMAKSVNLEIRKDMKCENTASEKRYEERTLSKF